MKFGRRAFIQFAAGAVGGSMLSPWPWQVLGDSARWTQNWSWRPSPERGEITKVPSVCTMCEGGCAIKARLVNGNRPILIEGNPANPLTEGGICALAASGLQFLYAPYRVSQPMKQTKSRGDASGFQPVSWDDAIAELVKKLNAMRSDGKSHTVACIESHRSSSMNDLWLQFFEAYGSPNLFKMPSPVDGLKLTAQLTTGHNSPFSFDLGNADYVLSFGANLFEGACAPSLVFSALRQWTKKGGVKLVQVESRCSTMASRADRFVAVAPGTEAALAMGIAHLMVTGGNYDADFVKHNVFGFEDWADNKGKKRQGFKSLVSSSAYSPDEIAKKTGLDAAQVREIAKEFAGSQKSLAIWAIGQPGSGNGLYHELAFAALNALKGNLKPNGSLSLTPGVPLADLPEVQKDPVADKASSQLRLDLAKSGPLPFEQNGLYGFLDGIANKSKYPVEMLLVHEANPSYSLAENKLFQAALEKVPMLVSFSSYMDETAVQADLILPDHTAFERYDDVVGIPGAPFSYYAVSAPVVKPLLKTRHTGDTLLAVAGAIGGSVGASLPWKSYEEYLKFRVQGLAQSHKGAVADKPEGVKQLSAAGSVQPNFSDGADLWKKLKAGFCWYDAPASISEFKTASGKFEFACQAIDKGKPLSEDQLYLPHFALLNPSGSESDLPLLLVPYRLGSIPNGYLPIPPFMRKLISDSVLKDDDIFVELNSQTAEKMGFVQSDLVVLKTTQGEAKVRINISAAARPGIVYLPEGLGHKAYDEYIQNKGINANSLMEVQLDPVSGMGTVWACRAQLRRA